MPTTTKPSTTALLVAADATDQAKDAAARLISVRELYSVDSQRHGNGSVLFKWNATGTLVASVGSSRVVYVCDSAGNLVDHLTLQVPIRCSALGWSADGRVLAVTQEHTKDVLMWQFNGRLGQNTTQVLDLGPSSETLFMAWSHRLSNSVLAVGVTRGGVTFIPQSARHRSKTITPTEVMQKQMQKTHLQTKRVVPAQWSELGLLAFVAENNRHVTCYSGILERVTCCFKLRTRITAIQWGTIYQSFDESQTNNKSNLEQKKKSTTKAKGMDHDVLSICIDAKTLIIYIIGQNGRMDNTKEVDVDAIQNDPESSDPNVPVVLEFDAKHGSIVTHTWLSDGCVLVGFSSGTLAVTSITSGGQRFLDVSQTGQSRLKSVKFSANAHMLAVCFEDRMVVIDTDDWREVNAVDVPENAGRFVGLQWTRGGRILSMATDGGCLLHYRVHATRWIRGAGLMLQLSSSASEVLENISCTSLFLSVWGTLLLGVLVVAFACGVGVIDVLMALVGKSLIL